MKIQINAGDHVHGSDALDSSVSASIEAALGRFSGQITRVEVHMSDENAAKGGHQHKRCVIEARLEGRQPVAVTEYAATMKQALHGATDKLVRLLGSTLDRLHEHRKHGSYPPTPDADPAP